MTTLSQEETPFSCVSTPGFAGFLQKHDISLVVSTYQIGKVLMFGAKPDGTLSIFERNYPRCMGIGISDDSQSFAIATKNQLYRLDNILPKGMNQAEFDSVYAPHKTWITGAVDMHDVVFNGTKDPIFVNTLFNCIATVSDGHSFKPVWKPPFISEFVAEDRCHLNGAAAENGTVKYVTCVANTNEINEWRQHKTDGGLVINVDTDEIVTSGLSMPHSPRLHQGKLWLLNSGQGELGYVEPATGKFKSIAFCPGFARGLAFYGDYAIVAVSKAREKQTFANLPVDKELKDRNLQPRCGLMIIDINSGKKIEAANFEGVVTELYDVGVLRGVKCPTIIGLEGDQINTVISINDKIH